MKVAIVGAGVSGLSVAAFLFRKDPALQIEIFEKSKALGGRMATRRTINGTPIDTGCQFLSFEDGPAHDFFSKIAPPLAVREIPQSIFCLPEGFIVERSQRYYMAEGMTQWSKSLIAQMPRLKVHFENPITSLQQLWDEGFDRVLVTAPGPQAHELGSKKFVEYHPCLCWIFSWHESPREAHEHYAFRDISSREGITWLAHEGLKRGQQDLWVVQISPEKSVEWHEAKLSPDAIEDLIQVDLSRWIPLFGEGEKTFIDQKFWKYAFPIQFGDATELNSFERIDFDHTGQEVTSPTTAAPKSSGLKLATPPHRRVYFLGDGFHGVGRVENAIESALAVADDFFID